METAEKCLIWIILCGVTVGQVSSGRVVLSGPSIQTTDLRAIDGYVASGLPLFADTHGFVLHSGMRPVIVKVKDPNKAIRDGIEQPNPGYYRDLPAVIPQGFEGIASSSFLLGNPIPPSKFDSPASGPVASFQAPLYKGPVAMMMTLMRTEPSRNELRNAQHVAEPSIRVENTLDLGGSAGNRVATNFYLRNPVVVQTSEFESNLPIDFKNPFYRNDVLASALAQESLPAPGEELVDEWNTNKIREGRVRDLLSGAGLI